MKKYFRIAIALLLLLNACKPKTEEEKKQDKEEKEQQEQKKEEKKISKRNYSINKDNSYSNLFLDSLAMESFISDRNLHDSLARRMRSFYNTRNYQFAWFSSDGLTEQARGLWNLHDYVITYDPDSVMKNAALQKKMDGLIEQEVLTVNASDKSMIQTELHLTYLFVHYMLNNYQKGYVKRKEMERFIPFQKQDALLLADSLINKKHKDDKYFEDINKTYAALKIQLKKYYDIVKAGGWPTITTKTKSFKKGNSFPEIAVIKKRLQVTGDMPVGDTSQLFTDTLETAIMHFQERFGYKPDGIITTTLIKDMNVPAINRLQQILMNMDRMRWLANEPKGNLIVVNIPEFMLHAYEGSRKAFDMVVVVGKEGNNTMMFNGEITTVVFSPSWHPPASIIKNEIVPAMNRNPNYLTRQNMEVVGRTSGGMPLIRQNPGPGNALGRVKFLFPNSFSIYMHDTPSKSFFGRDKRAFSHGCIRLKEPEKMANYVLRHQPEWTSDKIEDAMNAGKEKFVKLKDALPVIITYYTAWVDDEGRMNFREDIYDHDASLAKKMFK